MNHRHSFLFFLLALFLFSCSAPETPDQLLRKLMETKLKDGQFTEAVTPGTVLRVAKQNDGADYSIEGSTREQSEYLILTLQQNVDMEQQYFTALYKQDNGSWKSILESDFIPGKLDTLLDLNNDGSPEFIMDEYQSNSAGFDSYQFLYAILNKPYLQKIDTLSRKFFGGNAYNTISVTRNFESNNGETIIRIRMDKSDIDGESTQVTQRVFTYRWLPPNLVKEEIMPELSQGDMPEFPDPVTEDLAVSGLIAKWFPLQEFEGKLKRMQVCGSESFIEIVRIDQPTWREQGLQDAWEATIESVMPRRDETGEGYSITLLLSNGNKRVVEFLRNQALESTYIMDGRVYTSQPDKFEIVNSTEDCGN